MDTNDLTEKSYEILKLAEDIDHMVTVHIGAMCGCFKNEDEFLPNVIKFVQDIIDDPEDFTAVRLIRKLSYRAGIILSR